MQRASSGQRQVQQQLPPASCLGRSGHLSARKGQSSWGAPGRLRVLFFLAFWLSSCKGAPMAASVLQGEQDLQLWNEIDDVCSAILARDAQPQSSNTLKELCFMVLQLLQKIQESDEKDNTKRSSVLHPLLQLVSQLHERRPKRYKVDEELRIPGGVQSRGYFIFRPRNGRRSTAFR
ncbi:neuromedin-U isoform X2 [Sphaerodactylus townsendi]|uniref:neuromedin-U isoform X2 n=1 Tax=Sphaerodactylus townsendi TaxID=933632 RepID=UPI0020263AF2|nr:neuromedin-U isoform X2 [Sphaerodactylus townsendi]